MPSPSSSKTETSERYGLIEEVHFTINRNKRGWYVTELIRGMPRQTHGPFKDPLNRLEAMSYLIAQSTLNH